MRAHVPHRFVSISNDLQVLVIFPKGATDEKDAEWLAFDIADTEAKRDVNENIWNPSLDVATMRFGLYMLPEKLGGDSTLTHKVDEVNIVSKGSAKFNMDGEEIDVLPGSIMWVEEGVGHYFHSLKDDFDVLILFEKRN